MEDNIAQGATGALTGLKAFANRICQHLFWIDPKAEVGCHTEFSAGTWEVSLFPLETEIIGGAFDGARQRTRFVLDVRKTLDEFESVSDVVWQSAAAGPDDECGSHVSIQGKAAGMNIWLRILKRCPYRFTAHDNSFIVDRHRG